MEPPKIDGADDFVSWFGHWPSFHDAEVVNLLLARNGKSELLVHCFQGTANIDERGYYVLTHHALVSFFFEEVTDISLSGFNHQNVLSSLTIAANEEGHELRLGDCYGLAGSISGKGLSMKFTPGIPPASVYSR